MDRRWENVKKEHVLAAIRKLDSIRENYPEPRSTYLIYEGKTYPAKHIRGMAFEIANGESINKNEYSGGNETAIFLGKLGFEVKKTAGTEINPNKSARFQMKKLERNRVVSQKNAQGLSMIQSLPEFNLRTLEIDFQRIKLCYLKWFYYFIPPNEEIYRKKDEESSSGKGEGFKLLRSPNGRNFTLFPTGLRWVHVGPPKAALISMTLIFNVQN